MENSLSTILIVIVILVVVLLILREVNCWYWKINERIILQKEEISILNKILERLKNESNLKNKSNFKTKESEYSEANTSNEKNQGNVNKQSNKQDITSKKLFKNYNYKNGSLKIEVFEINQIPSYGDKVYIDDHLAPDGKYKIGFMWYIHVINGTISGISFF